MLAVGPTLSVRGEPMPTLIGFDRGTYDDRASSQIVVRITRVDQEPSVGENEQFSVECTINGGTAVEGVDYRLVLDGAVQGLRYHHFSSGRAREEVHHKRFEGCGYGEDPRDRANESYGPCSRGASGDNSVVEDYDQRTCALKAAPVHASPDRNWKRPWLKSKGFTRCSASCPRRRCSSGLGVHHASCITPCCTGASFSRVALIDGLFMPSVSAGPTDAAMGATPSRYDF